MEASYGRGDNWSPLGDLDLEWWNGALGADVALSSAPRFSLGPRFALARVAASVTDELTMAPTSAQRTLVTTLGGRAAMSPRIGRHLDVGMTFEASHSLGQIALTLSAADLPWDGWNLSWGLGLATLL